MKLQLSIGALAALVATQAVAGDFIDTRIAFAVADDNVLANAGESTISSPPVGIGAGQQNTQFYDNFNTRFSGFESLSHLTLYKKSPSFFEGFEAEAAMSVRFLELTTGTLKIADNSSYVKLNYRPPGWGPKEEVSFTGFPVSSDRFRMGYAWRISWGGDSIFTYQQLASPGAKLQLTRDRFYVFAGAKTGLLLNPLIKEVDRAYAVLGGGGVELLPGEMRVEVNGAWFQRGLVPNLAGLGIRAPVSGMGGSAQVTYWRGDSIQPSVDMRLYKNDPDLPARLFSPEKYPGGLSFQVALEGSFLGQTLEDPDTFARTKIQTASAAALQVRVKYDYWRFGLLGLYRTLSFIQFDVPGLVPFSDFSAGIGLSPEMFFALSADRYLPRLHLTPGLIVGLQNPASAKSPSPFGGNNPGANLQGQRTTVVRDVNTFNVLPGGTSVIPIFSVKGTAKLDISENLAGVGEVFYNRDPNRVTFRDSAAGVALPVFENEHQIGFNLVLQAKF